ncbi:hypothetical protein HJFPF1_06363 [Paramyrothecium foliicola]|nr:hypothetical protein HJFPF1_06363 [Paramyrothecium foliicola]
MSIVIAPVEQSDLPALADINRLAYSNEIISRFAWKNWPNDPSIIGFYNARVADRFGSAGTTMYKAVDSANGKIHGFVACTLEHPTAQEASPDGNPSSKFIGQLPPCMNLDFVKSAGGDIERMKNDKLKDDKSHFYISAFAVDPQFHGQGIGSQLLNHCLEIADKAALRTWLIAFPRSHSLYLRSGFKDVDHCDVDLNKWDEFRFRGYGVYRQSLMVRDPAGLTRI